MTTKVVNGIRIEMTPEEEARFEADRLPLTPEELATKEAAKKDELIGDVQKNRDALFALAEAVYLLASGQFTPNPDLTKQQFYTWLRNRMDD